MGKEENMHILESHIILKLGFWLIYIGFHLIQVSELARQKDSSAPRVVQINLIGIPQSESAHECACITWFEKLVLHYT